MPTTTEISDYVTGLSSATLTGAEEVYLATDEKATVSDIANFGGKVWKAQISQSGTSAPTLVELTNTLGVGALTTNYIATGAYDIQGFGGVLTGLIHVSIDVRGVGYEAYAGVSTSSILSLGTYISGVASNGVLDNVGFNLGTSVLTITKYD
jgi:hypothetical protein